MASMSIDPIQMRQMEAMGTRDYCSVKAKELFKMEQGSEQWHDERQLRVTASRIAVIAGLVSHPSIEDVLHEIFNPPKVTTHMQRGIDLQRSIADNYILDLQKRKGGVYKLHEVGLLLHPDYPHLSASMDYWVVNEARSEAFILEVKAPSREPDDLPRAAECQVVMQLAIAVSSELVDWLGSPPKAVVVAGVGDNLAFWDVPWDDQSQALWFEHLLPAAHIFYLEGVLPKLLENEERRACAVAAAAQRARTPPPERCLPLPDDSITLITPTMAVGKVVQRLNSNDQAVIVGVERKGIVLDNNKVVDNKKRKRPANPENYVVLPLSAHLCVAPSATGQRVMVVGGRYIRNPPLEGFVESWAAQYSQIKLDVGDVVVSVKNSYLHVNEKGAQPLKRTIEPVQDVECIKIPADKYDDFLSQLLDGGQLDLVLKEPHSRASKISQLEKFVSMAAEQEKITEDEAAQALCNLEL